jgi:hypothetical protein
MEASFSHGADLKQIVQPRNFIPAPQATALRKITRNSKGEDRALNPLLARGPAL